MATSVFTDELVIVDAPLPLPPSYVIDLMSVTDFGVAGKLRVDGDSGGSCLTYIKIILGFCLWFKQ